MFRTGILVAAALVSVAHEAAADDKGLELYNAECAACHGPAGAGNDAMGPRLSGRIHESAADPLGRKYLANVLTYGMAGEIIVDGETHNSYMPPVSHLSEGDRASILNYLSSLGTTSILSPFTDAEIKAATSKEVSAEEVFALRPKKKW